MLFRAVSRPVARPRAQVIIAPRARSLAAITRIKDAISGTEADFHTDGYARTITTTNRRGLLQTSTLARNGSIARHARRLVDQKDIVEAFELDGVELHASRVDRHTDGSYRIDFKQVLSFKPDRKKYQYHVRGGMVHVYMSKYGRIDQITSTVRHAEPVTDMPQIITPEQAEQAARAKHGADARTVRLELSFSLHEGKFNPVYDVVLDSEKPKKIYAYIVEAVTGEVVHEESKLHLLRRRPRQASTTAAAGVGCSTLLCVPNPDRPISEQMHEHVLKYVDPANPTVLGNDRYRVTVGSDDRQVKANADGSFKFPWDSQEARAVSNFFAVMYLTELFESAGARVAEQYWLSVDNDEVVDNAYCDYINRTLKIGVGSGWENGGLAKDEANDIGIVEHEAGHKFGGDEVPSGDLGGTHGAAVNEGTCGDCAYLVANFLMRLQFGKELGHTLTRDDIKNDGLVVGGYAVKHVGIRTLKNNKQAGKDETGEEHDDGEICGAATAELLVALATAPSVEIESGLRLYAQLYIKALSRLPGSMTFKDLLRAFISADQAVTKGANRKLIEACFANHSIKV